MLLQGSTTLINWQDCIFTSWSRSNHRESSNLGPRESISMMAFEAFYMDGPEINATEDFEFPRQGKNRFRSLMSSYFSSQFPSINFVSNCFVTDIIVADEEERYGKQKRFLSLYFLLPGYSPMLSESPSMESPVSLLGILLRQEEL